MKNVKAKFETLIRSLQYDQIKLQHLNPEKLKSWAETTMPKVVHEMKDLEWDLEHPDTWMENTFANHLLEWYGKRVAVFLTTSGYDYELCKRVLPTKEFANFRRTFNLDAHINVLVHPLIFLQPYDLDELFISIDWDKKYSSIDYSHFDEEDDLDEAYAGEWGWLQYEEDSENEWDVAQVARAYNQEIFKQSV